MTEGDPWDDPAGMERVPRLCRGDGGDLTSSLPAGSEQSLSVRNPVSTWAYLQHLRAIDSQKELLRLSRDLEP